MGKNARALLLKIELLKQNITQRSIAKELGFSESYVSLLFAGERSNEDFDSWLRTNLLNKKQK